MEGIQQQGFKQPHLSEKLQLYGILGSENLRGITCAEAVRHAINGGMTCLQIREKHASERQLLEIIAEIKPICDKAGVPLIINDDSAICKGSGASGVHLGLNDGSIEEARELLGDDKIVGATAHNLAEALAAETAGADYIGVGAAFGSNSKGNAVNLPSLDVYDNITAAVKIPVVAIGGINIDNIGELDNRGLTGVAVISSLFETADIERSARELRAATEGLSYAGKRSEK